MDRIGKGNIYQISAWLKGRPLWTQGSSGLFVQKCPGKFGCVSILSFASASTIATLATDFPKRQLIDGMILHASSYPISCFSSCLGCWWQFFWDKIRYLSLKLILSAKQRRMKQPGHILSYIPESVTSTCDTRWFAPQPAWTFSTHGEACFSSSSWWPTEYWTKTTVGFAANCCLNSSWTVSRLPWKRWWLKNNKWIKYK